MTLRTKATRPGQQWLALVVGILVLMAGAATAVLALVSDSGTFDVIVADSGSSSDLVLLDGDAASGSVEYIGSSADNQSSGTGTFDPFLRLQGDPTERGYNTNGPVAFETKPGKWTKAILASAIPIVSCEIDDEGTLGTCWEIFVDINENNTAKYVSLNEVEVWFTTNPNLVGYVEPAGFPAASGATQVYDFSGTIKIHDVNQGSGRGDLRYLIPVDNSFTSSTYFVLFSKWGTSAGAAPDGKTWASEGGFEEWKVRKAPNLSILKTANPVGPVSAGTAIGFDITVTNSGAAAATNFTITDTLPTGGGGLNWSLDPAFAGCSISVTTPQVLSCTFATLAAGASIGPIHITSPTTAADCGLVSNTAFLSSGGSSTATVTVQCGALQITKTAKHADTSGDTSANLDATFTITGPSPSTATATIITGADGVGCLDGLAFGDYSVEETGVPAGYAAPAATTVTVNNVASCSDATFVGEALTVDNTPLTDVQISIDSQHDGATSTLIECWGPGSDPATDPADYSATVSDGSLSIPGLDPTDPAITLNCQITVDP